MRIGRCLLALAALVASQITHARAAEQVDLLLALAMDVSRSMEQPKFLLQREGYAAAITNPQVLDAIKSGAHQKIAICFIDWSGAGEQKLVIDWSIIDGADSARHFGDLIFEAPRSFNDRTSIGGGITFAAAQIARSPFEAERHAIDVSGDGTNNAGRDVQTARDQAVATMETPSVRERLKDIGATVVAPERRSPEYLQKFVESEIAKWAVPIRAANITGE